MEWSALKRINALGRAENTYTVWRLSVISISPLPSQPTHTLLPYLDACSSLLLLNRKPPAVTHTHILQASSSTVAHSGNVCLLGHALGLSGPSYICQPERKQERWQITRSWYSPHAHLTNFEPAFLVHFHKWNFLLSMLARHILPTDVFLNPLTHTLCLYKTPDCFKFTHFSTSLPSHYLICCSTTYSRLLGWHLSVFQNTLFNRRHMALTNLWI